MVAIVGHGVIVDLVSMHIGLQLMTQAWHQYIRSNTALFLNKVDI